MKRIGLAAVGTLCAFAAFGGSIRIDSAYSGVNSREAMRELGDAWERTYGDTYWRLWRDEKGEHEYEF